VFELAKSPQALLKIVDEASEVDKRGWDEAWRRLSARMLSFRAKAREIEASLPDEGGLRGELEDVKRKLALFERTGHAEVLREYQRRLRQERLVESWQESWAPSGEQIRSIARDLVPSPLDDRGLGSDDEAARALIALSSEVADALGRVRDGLEGLALGADGILSRWRDDLEQSPWKKAASAAQDDYESLRKRLADGEVDDPSTYGALVQRRQSIEMRLAELGSQRNEAESMRREAESCLGELSVLRRELTDRRIRFLGDVLGDNAFVKIEVVPFGDGESAKSRFRELIDREKGGFEKDIDGLLSELYPDPWDHAGFEERLANLKSRVRALADGSAGAEEVHDQRFSAHLAKWRAEHPENLDYVDLWFPEDSLDVKYSPSADGASFRSIEEGSPGQKTAALLAFLLSYGDEPIVLDQPEDDLDNYLIYDLIVGQLRHIKQQRQVIVVTHNANIVVNGDAELVTALTVRGGTTQKACSGSLQERDVRETICAVMEGGEKAFKERYRRIALEGRHV
jgi:hypothetical protein